MGRPRANPSQPPTPDRVLAAALIEFGRAGYAAARLADIAEAAGITRPSLLYYFPSKDALYAAVVRDAFARLGAALASAMRSDGEFSERVDALVLTFVSFIDSEPALARLIVRELIDSHGPGRELIQTEAIPVLERVEEFVRAEGSDLVDDGLELREALLQVVSATLLRSGSGSLKEPLWGPHDHTLSLTRRLFFGVLE